jgi:iron(III) transport system permease protein
MGVMVSHHPAANDRALGMAGEALKPIEAHRFARRASTAGVVVVGLIIAAPVLILLASLFAPSATSLRHVLGTVGAEYAATTIALCAMVGLCAGVVGVVTALATSLCEFPFRRALVFASVLPLALPSYLAAYAYADFLGPFGGLAAWLGEAAPKVDIRSFWGAVFVLSATLYPYIFLGAHAAFASRSSTMIEAARMLGRAPMATALRLIAPASRPAIAGGVALAMMETAGDFGVSDYFGVSTLSVGIIRTWHSLGDLGAATQLASGLFLFVAAIVWLESLSRRGLSAESARSPGRGSRARLSFAAQVGAIALCAVPPLLGAAVPIAVLASLVDASSLALATRGLWEAISNSVSIGAASAALILLAAVLLAYAKRSATGRIAPIAVDAATLGYAAPGAVVAIGVIAALSSVSAVFAGTTALIYAYLVRFLTVGFNTVSGGLKQIAPTTDEAARMLGRSAVGIATAIHAPLMAKSIAAAAVLVFVDVIKELPATLILRDFNFETLATRIYRLASDERLAAAAPDALILIAVCAAPALLLTRLSLARDQGQCGLTEENP